MRKIINEIKSEIEKDKVKNIYQPIKDQILFQFSDFFLLFSLKNPSYLLLTEEKPELPESPLHFVSFLRKKIKGAKLADIKQIGSDRLGFLTFEYTDEVKGKITYRLYFELMGRNSNLIFTDVNDVILEALKKGVSEKRTILPGSVYQPYIDTKRTNVLDLKDDELASFLKSFTNVDDLLNEIMGLSNLTKKMIKERIENIDDFKGILQEFHNEPYLYLTKVQENKLEILPIKPSKKFQYETLTPSKAVSLFLKENFKRAYFLSLKGILEKSAKKKLEKVIKLKSKLERELENINYEKWKKLGELIKSNLYTLKQKSGRIKLWDWEENKYVEIEIEKGKNPQKLLEEYFGRYKKEKRKKEITEERLRELEIEQEYLLSIINSIELANDLDTLKDIKEELKEEGILKEKEKETKFKRSRLKSKPRVFYFRGFEILVGKNNKQNEELVRSASDKDLWFHTQDIPGSHVIIKSAGKSVPEEVIFFAARLAATFSKGKMSNKVKVDFTEIKNVWKPKGFKTGMVLYKNYKTLVVNPFEDIDNVNKT